MDMTDATPITMVTDHENFTVHTNVTTFIYPAEYYKLNALITFLNTYYIWIIFAFGFPGNTLSLFVIFRMSKTGLTTSLFYVAVLSSVDNITIILKIIENQTRQMKMSIDETGCQFLFFFGLTCAASANWTLIVISAERFTAVALPFKVALVWSLKRAVVIIVGVVVFLCFIHSHIFITVTHYEHYTCTVKERFHKYLMIWFFISASVFAFIPAGFLIVLNALTVLIMRRSTTRRQIMTSAYGHVHRAARRQERHITVMLVALAIGFLVLNIPRCVYVIAYNYICSSDEDVMCSTRRGFVNILTTQIADSNHAINFYLYFMTGRKFRAQTLKLFQCRRATFLSSGPSQSSEIPFTESS
ncbi:rhodopsin-like [Haliotis rufescens]|uniref:rhodopsin-like n=1 Tax=Haliotis rufescens TaxID=6454 RepID=UPI001EB0A0C3|nr:rhodopsin-like [Haliotis rufescens]